MAVHGASGKMGQQVLDSSQSEPDLRVTGAIVSRNSNFHSKLVPNVNHRDDELYYTSDLSSTLQDTDVVIDFSVPSAISSLLDECQLSKIGLVIGTTGFSDEQEGLIRKVANKIPIVLSPNMSTGVCVLWKLVEVATRALDNIDIEIFETHHRDKLDSPSGTALRIAETVNTVRGLLGKENLQIGRIGNTGRRQSQEIGMHSARGGDSVGEHTVLFFDKGERVEISHRALNRSTFAVGSLRAARFVAEKLNQKQTGLFSMQDVLGLTCSP